MHYYYYCRCWLLSLWLYSTLTCILIIVNGDVISTATSGTRTTVVSRCFVCNPFGVFYITMFVLFEISQSLYFARFSCLHCHWEFLCSFSDARSQVILLTNDSNLRNKATVMKIPNYTLQVSAQWVNDSIKLLGSVMWPKSTRTWLNFSVPCSHQQSANISEYESNPGS